jgi:uncharacterized membrane protein
MAERDTLLAVLQSDLALAGLILVFSGLIMSKAETYETKRGDKYRYLAAFGAVPIVVALASAWLCIDAIGGNQWNADHALSALRVVLSLTAVYVLAYIATVFT